MRAIQTALFGALAFWGPDVAVHAIWGRAFDGVALLIASVLMLAATIVASMRLDQDGRRTLVGWPRGILMVLGTWILGPFMMMIGTTFSGGGFLTWDAGTDWRILLSPAVTFIMATYDGALGALVFTTLALPIACGVKGHPTGKRRSHGAA